MHIKYPKIVRLWNQAVEWIFETPCTIQEKIDGANLSVRLDEDGETIMVWSRTKTVGDHETTEWFRWAIQYCKEHKGIRSYLTNNPTHRLYWERLVNHTIKYNEEHYWKFWLFDILTDWDEELPVFMQASVVIKTWQLFDIRTPFVYKQCETITMEDIDDALTKPNLWDRIEWVVIKSDTFVNKFWRPCYAKAVIKEFREENELLFDKKSKQREGDTWPQIAIALSYLTTARFLKILNKIEQDNDCKFSEKNIGEIIWRVTNDIIQEEIMNICKWFPVLYIWEIRKEIWNKTRELALLFIQWRVTNN